MSGTPTNRSRRRLLRTGLLGGALLGIWAIVGRSLSGYSLPAGVAHPRTLSDKELIVLAAIVARIVAPDAADAPAADGLAMASWLDGYLAGLDAALLSDVRALLHFVEHGSPLFRFRATRFSHMSAAEQDATLDAFADSPLTVRRQGLQALRALGFMAYYREDRTFAMLGYSGPMVQRKAAPLRIAPGAPLEATNKADLCVVGSGAGGAMVAREAARAGLRVIVLEEGPEITTEHMTQREDEMIPRLFFDGGGRTTVDGAITVLHGRGLGGSTIHNTNLCKRAPKEVLDAWNLDGWRAAELAPHYEAVEALLSVQPIEESRVNRNNAVLRAGATKLGWRHGILSHNRKGCVGSGFCELGCSFDAKQNAAKVLLPDAAAHGARIVTECRADELVVEGGRAVGVRAISKGRSIEVRAPVCIAGSAIGSALLAKRSRSPDPTGKLGRTLHLHPGAAVAGIFDEPIEAWTGIPQSWECTELLDFSGADPQKRVWIVPVFAHPIGLAAMLPGFGASHMRMMRMYPRMAVLTAMLHDESTGEVEAAGARPKIRYGLNDRDQTALLHGMRACGELLFAAGARKVIVPFARPIELGSPAELDRITAHKYRALDPLLAAAHPMGTMPLGTILDEQGRYRGVGGLWVADGSVFPTSIGGPPQLTIYAAARKVAGHLVQELGK